MHNILYRLKDFQFGKQGDHSSAKVKDMETFIIPIGTTFTYYNSSNECGYIAVWIRSVPETLSEKEDNLLQMVNSI